ncbi:MAG TPA: AsnC family transcriptional regulator [Deltaproteobacteria bacterium]|nr:AsnC family transcriptional regulator [Deltaproteobacteria bacterium]HPJ93664.1 AsnC family transcriptional regulator [Deltaproteobacteria bacterium]
MDTIDKKILTLVNKSLPVDERPYGKIAETLGLAEQEVIERLRSMRAQGLIRRIGAVINPRRIGWHSTLCAMQIPEEKLDYYADTVNSYPEITHNYIRSGQPNCWFTLITPDKESSLRIISEIEQRLGERVLDLPARRVFKIKVAFDLE